MFELIMNILLFVFLGYSYFTHVLEAKIPKSYTKNPYNLMPDVWPKIIIALMGWPRKPVDSVRTGRSPKSDNQSATPVKFRARPSRLMSSSGEVSTFFTTERVEGFSSVAAARMAMVGWAVSA